MIDFPPYLNVFGMYMISEEALFFFFFFVFCPFAGGRSVVLWTRIKTMIRSEDPDPPVLEPNLIIS